MFREYHSSSRTRIEYIELPPLEELDELCRQQAKKEMEAMERKIEVVAPSKSLEAMIEIFERKAKNL
jgi:hypothetical protein